MSGHIDHCRRNFPPPFLPNDPPRYSAEAGHLAAPKPTPLRMQQASYRFPTRSRPDSAKRVRMDRLEPAPPLQDWKPTALDPQAQGKASVIVRLPRARSALNC